MGLLRVRREGFEKERLKTKFFLLANLNGELELFMLDLQVIRLLQGGGYQKAGG